MEGNPEGGFCGTEKSETTGDGDDVAVVGGFCVPNKAMRCAPVVGLGDEGRCGDGEEGEDEGG